MALRALVARRALLARLTVSLLAVALGAACNGLVVEPVDQGATYGATKFWGYAGTPGEPVRLEAQSTSWEPLVSGVAQSTPTHVAGYTGYYFELWYTPTTIATRFRKTSPLPGYWRSWFRVVTANGVATTRQNSTNTVHSTSESWLERFWADHTATEPVIRLDVRP